MGGRSKNPDAVDLTMRGIGLLIHSKEQSRDEVHAARALFERALQIDPNHAQALAGSANTYYLDWIFGWGDPGTDYEAKVLGQANRAIDLTPDDFLGYYAKAQYLSLSGRYSEALAVANAGLAINPNYVVLYIPRAAAENSLGRYEQAKADVERAMQLSPHDPGSGAFHVIAGDAEINLGHFEAAIAEYRAALN